MKKWILLLPFCFMLLALAGLANPVVVKGVIKTANGTPVPNKKVWVYVEINQINTCKLLDSAITSPNGAFSTSLSCDQPIKKIAIRYINCEGVAVIKIMEVPTSGVLELVLADCIRTDCKAVFAIQPFNNVGRAFTFNSQKSEAGGNNEIVKRIWTFGDGTANEGNNVIVQKEYTKAGKYEVCLKIITRNGCTSVTCQTITIPEAPVACKAGIVSELLPTATAVGVSYRFNSKPSQLAAGDEIVGHKWTFGDGATLGGNVPNPAHTYLKPGRYEVCLTITTKKGCESKTCMVIEIPTPNCKPDIIYEWLPITAGTTGRTVRFNSKYAPNQIDNIISRTWTFGDGVTLAGNEAAPVHVYRQPGTYSVCLVTKTSSGCISEVCIQIIVEAPTPRCEAQMKWENGPENSLYLSASPSALAPNDVILKTTWWFGDGTTATVQGLETKHLYDKAGTYEVCLVIQTKLGCESKICKQIVVANTNANARCAANFTADMSRPGMVLFNSETASTLLPGDKIVSRRWDFGNGQVLQGNVVKPQMQYPFGGKFVVCLVIKTEKGCEARICKTIEVREGPLPVDLEKLWLVRQYPNPVREQLYAVVYSPKANEQVELAILDVYGVVKSVVKITVPKGYSTQNIRTNALMPGPYLLRLRSAYGIQSKGFYKTN